VTRGEATTLVRELIDDRTATGRWPTASLNLLATTTLDELYDDLMEAAPNWRRTVEEPTVASPGYVDLTGTTERFVSVIKNGVVRGGIRYSPITPSQVIMEDNAVVSAPDNTYVIWGDQLWLFPLATTTVELTYLSRPTSWADLADDGQTVVWPSGYDSAYVFEIAARAMIKGAAEEPNEFRAVADRAMARCLRRIKKQYPGPVVVEHVDSPLEWGSIE